MIPFLSNIYPVPKLVNSPIAKQLKETITLLSVIPKNIGTSSENLASALHNEIYRNKREKWSRIITFWTREVPQTMYDARRELLTSFIIFIVSVLIGVISAANDPNFVRLILGNGYVDMTYAGKLVGRQARGLLHYLFGFLPFFNVPTDKRNFFHAFQGISDKFCPKPEAKVREI